MISQQKRHRVLQVRRSAHFRPFSIPLACSLADLLSLAQNTQKATPRRNGGRPTVVSSSMRVHEPLHRDHVVVEITHDPHRPNNQYKYNKNTERHRHHIVHHVGTHVDLNQANDHTTPLPTP